MEQKYEDELPQRQSVDEKVAKIDLRGVVVGAEDDMAVEAEDKDYNSEDELQNLEVQDDETAEKEAEVADPAAAGDA